MPLLAIILLFEACLRMPQATNYAIIAIKHASSDTYMFHHHPRAQQMLTNRKSCVTFWWLGHRYHSYLNPNCQLKALIHGSFLI